MDDGLDTILSGGKLRSLAVMECGGLRSLAVGNGDKSAAGHEETGDVPQTAGHGETGKRVCMLEAAGHEETGMERLAGTEEHQQTPSPERIMTPCLTVSVQLYIYIYICVHIQHMYFMFMFKH